MRAPGAELSARAEFQMAPLPVIREALASDVAAVASLHVRAWRAAYRGHMPDDFLDALDPSARAAMWTKALLRPDHLVLVADDASGLVGFCSMVPARDSDAGDATAELSALYVDPSRLRSGVGSRLLDAAVAAAGLRGFRSMNLWVLRDNAGAIAFYRSRGFLPDGAIKTEAISTFEVAEVRLRRRWLSTP